MENLILTINPGSTSTKIALFENDKEIFKENLTHNQEDLEKYLSYLDQTPMRKDLVLASLEKHGYKPSDLAIVMGRGGLFPPIKTGGYKVNKKMLDMILNDEIPPHASNLGAVIAYEIAQLAGVESFIYDAVSAGELPEIAQITGLKDIVRKSFYHVLNTRASAIRYAKNINKSYDELNLIVVHLGGGITVGVHHNGKIIDSLSDDNGPFAPERAGSLPLLDFIELCYSGKYTKKEMQKKIRGLGGLRDLIGTSDGREISKRIEEGDMEAKKVMDALAYQVAKGIGLLAPVLKGNCDAIILTGGLAYNEKFTEAIIEYISFIAEVIVMPGEYEMEALALGGLRILTGEESYNEM